MVYSLRLTNNGFDSANVSIIVFAILGNEMRSLWRASIRPLLRLGITGPPGTNFALSEMSLAVVVGRRMLSINVFMFLFVEVFLFCCAQATMPNGISCIYANFALFSQQDSVTVALCTFQYQ